LFFSFAEAAEKGVSRAVAAGSKKPLLVVHNGQENVFPEGQIVSVLGALEAAYVPLEVREEVKEKAKNVEAIGVFGKDKVKGTIEKAKALEAGRVVSRDIGGSDPERMAAPRIEEYVRKTFEGTSIKVEVMKGQSTFEKEYPCLAAVNRAASTVSRHDGRVIWLTYEPEGKVEKTLMMVGKGITYDTGGADIKAGGIMAGMSRDKCGAADVAGVIKVISVLKPKNVKVIAAMACVRNSVGEECYVADEIITSRAGVRIRVGNTDAEVQT
jgi:leucyl aminopeptidase